MRLSTLNRINRAADDPAALIAAERLESELTAIQTARANAARAVGAVRVADSAMAEVGQLLDSIRGHVIEAAGGLLGDSEIEARQIEVNAAVEAVNRISRYTSYGGRKLLDGSAERLLLNLSPSPGETSVLSLPNVHASSLGGETGGLREMATGGSLSLAKGDHAGMIRTLDRARDQVLQARAKIGAFEKYSIESGMRVLDRMEESVASAVNRLRDVDVAEESSHLLRAQILVDSGLSLVGASMESRSLVRHLLA